MLKNFCFQTQLFQDTSGGEKKKGGDIVEQLRNIVEQTGIMLNQMHFFTAPPSISPI